MADAAPFPRARRRPKGFYWVDSSTMRTLAFYQGATVAHWDGKIWTVTGCDEPVRVTGVVSFIPVSPPPRVLKRRVAA